MTRSFLHFFFALFLLSMHGAGPSQAQEMSEVPQLDFRLDIKPEGTRAPLTLETMSVYVPPFEGYAPIDFAGMFKLYFKAGVVKEGDEVVEEYLGTSECKIYKQTRDNDFLWPDVLKSTRAFLRANKKNFPSMFTLVQPIALDRYDPDLEHFMLTKDTQYSNVKLMSLGEYKAAKTDCEPGGDRYYVKHIPTNPQIKFTQPFSILRIKMSPQMAKTYIRYIESQKPMPILELPRKRYAFVKFYFTVRGLDLLKNEKDVTTFLGTMDGYVIYADQDESMPLMEWSNPRAKEEPPKSKPKQSLSFDVR